MENELIIEEIFGEILLRLPIKEVRLNGKYLQKE